MVALQETVYGLLKRRSFSVRLVCRCRYRTQLMLSLTLTMQALQV